MPDLLHPALRWLVICGMAAWVLWPAPAGTAAVLAPADTSAAEAQLQAAADAAAGARARWSGLARVAEAREASVMAGIECGLSRRTAVAVYEAEQAYELPAGLLLAVIRLESSCDESAIGWNESSVDLGLAQINYTRSGYGSTGPWLAEVTGENPLDPIGNVAAAAWYLAFLLKTHGTVPDALTAYNTGGPGDSAYSRAVIAQWQR